MGVQLNLSIGKKSVDFLKIVEQNLLHDDILERIQNENRHTNQNGNRAFTECYRNGSRFIFLNNNNNGFTESNGIAQKKNKQKTVENRIASSQY